MIKVDGAAVMLLGQEQLFTELYWILSVQQYLELWSVWK